MSRVRRFFLEFSEELRPSGECGFEVVCCAAGPIPCVNKDAAGFYFHLIALKQAGLWVDPAAAEAAASSPDAAADVPSSPSGAAAADADKPPPGVDWKGSKARKKKSLKKKDGADPYSLLGLSNERWTATEPQIRAAYRRACLEHHPDKALINVTDEVEKERIQEHFKTIQDAYDTLSDPAKRREFDSTDEFDDTLPVQCDPKDFFKVFGPAFRRNTRWSSVEPVPDVGDDSTSWEDVSKFYDFWYTFKSWREFPHADEEDVECAESREHRRWIERNNSKLREKGKKEEGRRLRDFVDAAYKFDPRVLRKKDEDRMERERKKAEKEEARRRAIEEEEARKAAEEAAKKAAEDEAKRVIEEARKVREAAKAQVKQLRKKLRIIAEGSGGTRLVSEDDVEKLISKLEPESLSALVDSLAACGGAGDDLTAALKALVAEALRGIDLREEEAVRAREAAKRDAELAAKAAAREEHKRKMAAMREWTEEELRLLDKACTKFPMGTPKRWDAVAAFVRTRTLEEVLLMVKDKQGASATRMKAQEDWKGAQKKPAEVTSQADTRAEAFTDVEVNLTGEAAAKLLPGGAVETAEKPVEKAIKVAEKPVEKVVKAAEKSAEKAVKAAEKPAEKAVKAAEKPLEKATSTASTAAAAPAAAPAVPSAPAAAPATPASSDAASAAAPPAAVAAAAPAAAAAAPAAAKGGKKAASADSAVWSEAQELALVAALKQCPKELGPERWDAVSALVPGKTKAQCFKRFKELRDAFRSKKQTGGADGGDYGDD